MRHRTRWASALLAVAVGLAACGGNDSQDIGDPLADLAAGIVNGDADRVIAAAEQAGGAGGKVTRTEAFFLEVANPSSPIFGAAISVEAEALPFDAKNIVATLVPGANLEPPESGITRAGPVVDIAIVDLATGKSLSVFPAARVLLPYNAAIVTDVALIQPGHRRSNGSTEILQGRSLDSERARVHGFANTFSPYFALQVSPTTMGSDNTNTDDNTTPPSAQAANTLRLRVAELAGTQCNDFILLGPASGFAIQADYRIADPATAYAELDLHIVLGATPIAEYRVGVVGVDALPGTADVDPGFPTGAAWITATVACQNGTPPGPTAISDPISDPLNLPQFARRSLRIRDFVAQTSVPRLCGGESCTEHSGTAWIRLDFEITEGNTDGEITLDAIVNTVWQTVP